MTQYPKKQNKSKIAGTNPSKIRIVGPFRMTLTRGQEKALDALWSKAVKARAGNRCEMCCSQRERLEAHHAIGRRNKTLRHVVSNGFSLCHNHHRYAEQNGIAFAQWAIQSRGQGWWNALEIQARNVKVWKEYSIIKNYLESFL